MDGSIFFMVLLGYFWLIRLNVSLPECPVLVFHLVTSPVPLLFPLLCTHVVPLAPCILSLLPRCLCSLLFVLSGSLRFRPRNSVLAPGQGSAHNRTTTGREGWGGWVCPSTTLPVGFDLFVFLRAWGLTHPTCGNLSTLGGFLIKKTEDSISVKLNIFSNKRVRSLSIFQPMRLF